MKKLLILAIGLLLLIDSSFSQGCVAIRNLAGMGQFAQLGYGQTSDKWMLDINNRYFEAYNVFAGTKSQGYDSINIYEYTMNLELSHIMKNGWAISVDMPIAANTSVSSLEHASGYRHSTHAFGLGDIRLTVYKWLFDTKAIGSRGNIQVGLGLKFPTGNYHTEDYFYDDPT